MKLHDRNLLRTAAVTAAAAVLTGCGNGAAVQTAALPPAAVLSAETIAEKTPAAAGYTPHSELLDCLYYSDRDFHIYDERSTIYETKGRVLCAVARLCTTIPRMNSVRAPAAWQRRSAQRKRTRR